ncbi:uncharacterized protein EV420DRAFT_121612 [Desarmillaria tabescens]|uniref:RRM domain-containing protein n=1 Tax=Armillaria tabescens TaxID=1929756 RepID=A0AA39N9U4_ARMTA|nr:uncharacterized protein EV420DRAFT_121612 [Desarmillaria tabescens]KAK0461679.1 hypothetical protein EV420DRAFT_121612 [Desarmillaria tabescens]
MFRPCSFTLRRHVLNRSLSTSAVVHNSPSPSRLVRIGNLTDGYDIQTTLYNARAIPVEKAIPSKDHLLLWFPDTASAARVVDAKSRRDETLTYEGPIPPLSAKVAAHIGLGAFRKIRILNLPISVTVDSLRETFADCWDVMAHTAIVKKEQRGTANAYLEFADIRSAIKAMGTPKVGLLHDTIISYANDSRSYNYPPFVHAGTELRYGGRRGVVISGIKAIPQVEQAIWSTIGSKTEPLVLDSEVVASQNSIVLKFATAKAALEFKNNFTPSVEALGVQVELQKLDLDRSAISVIGLGGSRTLCVRANRKIEDSVQFEQFGPVMQVVTNNDITEVTFKSFHDAMNALLQLESGAHSLTGFDGASIYIANTEPVTVAYPTLSPQTEPTLSAQGKNFLAKAEEFAALSKL